MVHLRVILSSMLTQKVLTLKPKFSIQAHILSSFVTEDLTTNFEVIFNCNTER